MIFENMLTRLGIPKRIARAFDEIPREMFADPSESRSRIYSDVPIITFRSGEKYSTTSQPSLMADFMLWTGLEEGMKVLEIGGGTGYNAAVMAKIVGDRGLVVSVEYDPDVYARGTEILGRFGFRNLLYLNGDGYYGYSPKAPYDAIICTVGVDEVPIHWAVQLRSGGRMMVPLNLISRSFYQPAFLYERSGDWLKLEYKVATGFLKAGGMLGNLNSRNLEKLEKLKKIPEVDRISGIMSGLDVLEVLTASVANDMGRYYFVGDEGYAVWRRYYWEIHGRVDTFVKVYNLLSDHGFPSLESRAFAYRIDRTDFEIVERF